MTNIPFKQVETAASQSLSASIVIIVLALLGVYMLYKHVKNKGAVNVFGGASNIRVKDKKYLSASTAVYVVEHEGREFVICESSKHIEMSHAPSNVTTHSESFSDKSDRAS